MWNLDILSLKNFLKLYFFVEEETMTGNYQMPLNFNTNIQRVPLVAHILQKIKTLPFPRINLQKTNIF